MIRRFFRSASLLAFSIALATASFALATASFAQQKEVPLHRPQSEIAEDLASSDRLTARRALSDYELVSIEEKTQELRAAAAQALRHENERTRQFYLSGERPPPEEYDYMYGFHLFEEVLTLRDPAYVDALLPWLCCGYHTGWIDMGEEAIRPVLRFVYANEPGYEEAVRGGIYVLQMMVDHWGLDAFSSSGQEQLRQIAFRHIANEDDLGEWANLMPAINLAYAIKDTDLVRMAQAIATDEDEMRKRRITDDWDINYLRGIVSAAVSGTLKPYRHLTPEEEEKRIEELYEKMMENPEEFYEKLMEDPESFDPFE